jgi:two-component system, OmpR family, response regulator
MEPGSVTILIVDDDKDYLIRIHGSLKGHGYNIITAEGRVTAESLLEKTKPDLAIIDLILENDDSGFVLCYRMKQKYPDVPVIVANGNPSETGILFDLSDSKIRKWIKADRFINKSLNRDLLLGEIDDLLLKNTNK